MPSIRYLPRKLRSRSQTAAPRAPSEYSMIEETMAPLALRTMSDWIRAGGAAGQRGRQMIR
jgi:hypothetical protein